MALWVPVSDVKAQLAKLQFDYSLWSDGEIQATIELQQKWFERQLRRKVENQPFSEYYDGNGKERLVLNQYPVTVLTKCQILGPTETLIDEVNVSTLQVDYARGVLTFVTIAPLTYFPEGCKNIYVEYTAGYTSIPAELVDAVLKAACLDMITGTPTSNDIQGIKSVRILNYSATYGGAYAGLVKKWEEQIQDVIMGFRRTILF